jgi:hypothetical protein
VQNADAGGLDIEGNPAVRQEADAFTPFWGRIELTGIT